MTYNSVIFFYVPIGFIDVKIDYYKIIDDFLLITRQLVMTETKHNDEHFIYRIKLNTIKSHLYL